ncbi:MAG: A/G-specific adenine glycosylase [Oscillospiraceae bacterium]|jgi:A/G-specific adenine glycosylase|nr:A/G-specific adenine glycosylase [Oscillospiraceae bacterium]
MFSINFQTMDRLLTWYDQNRRDLPWRGTPNAYHTWISEIMLQQTRVEAVLGYYTRFLAALPDVAALAEADEGRLLKLWEGLGYYSRARNLQKAARLVMERCGGALPRDPETLLTLPGVGAYTAGAIASIAYGLAVPAVDGNVLRILARLEARQEDITTDGAKRSAAARLQPLLPPLRPGDANQALMDLGAMVCLPNGTPLCDRCPLAEECLAFQQGRTAELPVRTAKKPRRTEQRTVLILRWGERLALRRRESKRLLAGLWELPNSLGDLGALALELGIAQKTVLTTESLGDGKHIFTHLEWHMSAWRLRLSAPPPGEGLTWVTETELREHYALPSAFKPFRNKLFEEENLGRIHPEN